MKFHLLMHLCIKSGQTWSSRFVILILIQEISHFSRDVLCLSFVKDKFCACKFQQETTPFMHLLCSTSRVDSDAIFTLDRAFCARRSMEHSYSWEADSLSTDKRIRLLSRDQKVPCRVYKNPARRSWASWIHYTFSLPIIED